MKALKTTLCIIGLLGSLVTLAATDSTRPIIPDRNGKNIKGAVYEGDNPVSGAVVQMA